MTMRELDARVTTPDALAEAAADGGGRVALRNLRVRHRRRKGAKIFFLDCECGGGVGGGGSFVVVVSCMVKRNAAGDTGDGCDDTRLGPLVGPGRYCPCLPRHTRRMPRISREREFKTRWMTSCGGQYLLDPSPRNTRRHMSAPRLG